MNEQIKLILSLSLSGSIVAGVIFAIKPFIKYRLSKSIQYYIWIVVLLRLLIPFSFENSIMNRVFYGNQTSVVIESQAEYSKDTVMDKNTNSSSILPSVKENVANGDYNSDTDHTGYFRDLFNMYIYYIWLFGAILAFLVNLISYIRFIRKLKLANKPVTEYENEILNILLDKQHNIRLVRNHHVTTPMLIGIVRPCIIIPDIELNQNQFRYILLHELTHLKRFDIPLKWLTMLVTSLHWFNPSMYFIKKEINNACELACDEAVIKNLSSAEKQSYGDTLISVASKNKYPMGALQTTMSNGKKTLKERLVSIMKYNKKSKPIIIISLLLFVGVILVSMVLGAGVGLNLSNEAEYKQYTNNHITFNYPSHWKINVSQHGNNESILLKKNSDSDNNFAFGINLEVMEDVKSEDEINKELEEAFKDLINDIEGIESGQVISYEETTINGEKARKLIREVKFPDIEIEHVYLILKEQMSSYDEVKTYINQYEEVEAFISEIKDNPEELQELEVILEQLDSENQERKDFINRAMTRMKKSLNQNDWVLKGFNIGFYKENIRLYILWNSHEKEYDDEIKTIQKIVDSITFKN